MHLGQGDSFTRWIELTLLCDGVPYDPTADLSALGIQDGSDADIIKTVKYIKANGVSGEYENIPEDGTTPAVALMDGETNVYIVRLDEHATDVPGFAEVSVTFYVEDSDGDIHVLHSFPITIDVVQNTTNATDPGSPYYNIHSFYVKPVGGIPLNDLSESAKGIFSDEAKYSLIALLSKVAYIDTHGQQYIDDLTQKLFPTAYLVSITADYEQDRPIYDTDDLDAIKASDDLTVTANYSDGSSVVLGDDDYTLSGTLTAGTSTITVSYSGKTDTIEVIVTPFIPAEYQQVEWIGMDGRGASDNERYVDLGITPDLNTGLKFKIRATGSLTANFFGIRQSNTSADNAMLLQGYSSAQKFGVARWGSAVQTISYDNNWHDVEIMPNKITFDGEEFSLEAPASGQSITLTLRLFGVYASVSGTLKWFDGSKHDIGGIFYVYNGTAITGEFVPCYRKSDNAIGVYDRIGETFIAGHGGLLKGDDV